MTRVAIIGNSHIGAYMLAREAIEAAFPKVALSFFALPRHSFSSCRYDENGVLIAREPAAEGLPDRIDLSRLDHILMVGQSFGREGLGRLVRDFDVLGLVPRGRARSVSLALVSEYTDFRVERYCRKLARFLREDPRCVVAPTPFPAMDMPEWAIEQGGLLDHPDADRLTAIWLDAVLWHMAPLKYGLMPQPAALVAAPGRSPAAYARAAALPDGQTPTAADFTHMNAEYGFEHFSAYAHHWLGLAPQSRTTSPSKEHHNGLGPQ
jgi:hypothetical protein